MSFWATFGVVGAALSAWVGLLALLARYGRAGVRAVSAHVAATTANTLSLDTLTTTVREHITSTNSAVEKLDERVTRLEHP